jgi:hypothetical protein
VLLRGVLVTLAAAGVATLPALAGPVLLANRARLAAALRGE